MAQLEYGDYYKFFVSCGIALIIVSIGLPWLFLHESFDLLLESSKLSALTKTAQTVITQRQNIVAFMLNVIPFVSPVFFGTGVFMSFYGLWRWSGRQVVRYKSEDLDVEKKEHELKDMTKSEVLAKVEAEVANQSVSTISLPNPQASGTAVKSYLRYEEIFFETLRKYVINEYLLLLNQRAAAYEIDAVLKSKSADTPQFMIEFKKVQNANASILIDAIRQVAKASDWVGLGENRGYVPMAVIAYSTFNAKWHEDVTNFLDKYDENPTAIGRAVFRFISLRRLPNLSPEDMHRVLNPSERILVLGSEDDDRHAETEQGE